MAFTGQILEKVYSKKCSTCGLLKTEGEFWRSKTSKDGLRSNCKTCAAKTNKKPYAQWSESAKANHRQRAKQWELDNPLKAKNKALMRCYGLTLDDYNQMLEDQNSKCAVCGKHISELKQEWLFVDHCHKTGRVRGLLCSSCNTYAGFIESHGVDLLFKLQDYLQRGGS